MSNRAGSTAPTSLGSPRDPHQEHNVVIAARDAMTQRVKHNDSAGFAECEADAERDEHGADGPVERALDAPALAEHARDAARGEADEQVDDRAGDAEREPEDGELQRDVAALDADELRNEREEEQGDLGVE